jgi:DNA-binding Xre family transcriptional regulator
MVVSSIQQRERGVPLDGIRIKLREAIEAYERRTGIRLTYLDLSTRTGLSLATLQSIGSREGYNATLEVIARLCKALDTTPGELLEWEG